MNHFLTYGQQEKLLGDINAQAERLQRLGFGNITSSQAIKIGDSVTSQASSRNPLSSQELIGITNMASGLASIASGIIGGAQRREEQRAAKAAYEEQLQAYRALDTSSPYRDITNPYEDLTVNQQQAQFIAQQQQQGLATTMASVGAAAGGSGIAALAQAMAQQQARNLQQASATIGAQEAANERLRAQGEARRQELLAQGEAMSMQMEASKTGQLLGLERARLQEANLARQQATAALIGGVGALGAGVMQFDLINKLRKKE